MSIKVSEKNWKDIDFRIATTAIARMFGETIEIELPKVKFKPYNAQIWKNDDIVFESDFDCKRDALKWITAKLQKESNSYADLKKYNKKRDDFDWWFYKYKNNRLEDVTDLGEVY